MTEIGTRAKIVKQKPAGKEGIQTLIKISWNDKPKPSLAPKLPKWGKKNYKKKKKHIPASMCNSCLCLGQ